MHQLLVKILVIRNVYWNETVSQSILYIKITFGLHERSLILEDILNDNFTLRVAELSFNAFSKIFNERPSHC